MSTYKIYFSNGGLPGSGLSPEFISLNNVSNGSGISFPAISGISTTGWYKFDLTVSEDVIGVVYGSGLSDTDGYLPVDFTVNDQSLDAAITTRPTASTIVTSGNAANWSGVADVSALALEASISGLNNVSIDTIVASGNASSWNVYSDATAAQIDAIAGSGLGWTTADVSALPTITTIVASGDAAGWGATASGALTVSDMYTILGLNTSGVIDELATAPIQPNIAQSMMLGYMQRRNEMVTDKDRGTTVTTNDAGATILTATVSDDDTKFTKSKLS